MITAFQSNAFQSNPLAFQIASGPAPTPPYPDETGAGGLNIYDPSVQLEYTRRVKKSQETRAEFEKRQREEKEEIALLVARAYNKALGIEEPEESVPEVPTVLLSKDAELEVSKAAREAAAQVGLQISLRNIGAFVRARKAEAMARAYREDVDMRLKMILEHEAAEEAEVDRMMDEAQRLFSAAQDMLK